MYGYELLPSSEELRGAAQAVDAAAAGRSGHEWAWALNGSTCTQVFHGQHAGTGQPPALSPEGHECRPAVAVTQNGAGADAECSGSLMDSSSMYEQQAAGGDMLQADLEMEIRSSQRSMNTSAHLVGHDCPGTCSGVSMPKKGSALPSLVPGMNVDQAVASLFMSVLSPTAADASGTGAAVGACKRERSQGHDCASPVSALLAPHRCVRRSSGPAAVCLQPSLQGSASSPDTATDSEGTPCASAASCPWVLAADHSCSRHAGPIAALPHGLGAGGMRSCSSCVQLGGTPGTKDDVVQEEAAGQPESAAGASDVASGHAEVVKNGGTRLPIQLSCKDSPGLTPALADEPDASTSDGRSACASYELTVQERARILGSQVRVAGLEVAVTLCFITHT